jgi:hypothetical protein
VAAAEPTNFMELRFVVRSTCRPSAPLPLCLEVEARAKVACYSSAACSELLLHGQIPQFGLAICKWLHGVVGYHMCLTHTRSPDRAWVKSFIFLMHSSNPNSFEDILLLLEQILLTGPYKQEQAVSMPPMIIG